MPGITIEQVSALVDPLKGYQYRVIIAPLPAGLGAPVDIMSIRVTTATLPGSDIDPVETHLGGHTVRHAGRRRFSGTWTTTLVEGQDAQILKRLSSWQQMCYDQRTGKQAGKQNYQSRATIELYDDPGVVTFKRQLYGVWPQSVPDLSLDMNSSEAAIMDITWAFDFWDDTDGSATPTGSGALSVGVSATI